MWSYFKPFEVWCVIYINYFVHHSFKELTNIICAVDIFIMWAEAAPVFNVCMYRSTVKKVLFWQVLIILGSNSFLNIKHLKLLCKSRTMRHLIVKFISISIPISYLHFKHTFLWLSVLFQVWSFFGKALKCSFLLKELKHKGYSDILIKKVLVFDASYGKSYKYNKFDNWFVICLLKKNLTK